jgi:hypothetical protein
MNTDKKQNIEFVARILAQPAKLIFGFKIKRQFYARFVFNSYPCESVSIRG